GLEAAIEDLPDLLLTDMRMPMMAGAELIALIKLCRPDLPVVLMTGYRNAVPTARPDNLAVLIKPSAMQDLVKAAQTRLRRVN
ncbi:response regulator, partial [Azospirillum sp. TSH7]